MVKPQQPLNLDDLASFTVTGAAGEFVYKTGTPSRHLYIVQDGKVEILDDAGGAARQIAVLEAGDIFGEAALGGEAPRDSSARGVTAYRLLKIDRATLVELVQENPEIAVHIVQRLGSRLRAALRPAPVAPGPAAASTKPPQPVVAPSQPAPKASPSKASMPAARAAAAPAAAKPGAPGMLVHVASGTEFRLKDTGEMIVGRHDRATHFTPDIDLSPLDEQRTLSRRHATIARRGAAFHVQEAATRNGTFVNGKRVPSGVDVQLNDGDVVRFGMIETVFRCR
jgi:hypothetical protein